MTKIKINKMRKALYPSIGFTNIASNNPTLKVVITKIGKNKIPLVKGH